MRTILNEKCRVKNAKCRRDFLIPIRKTAVSRWLIAKINGNNEMNEKN